MSRILVACLDRRGEFRTPSGRHWWAVVQGVHATPEHPYTERRCRRCGIYESEVR